VTSTRQGNLTLPKGSQHICEKKKNNPSHFENSQCLGELVFAFVGMTGKRKDVA
jgi:hypothetical protein